MTDVADATESSPLTRALAAKALGTPFSSTNQPPASSSAIRSDARILQHYRDNTFKIISKLYDMAMNDDLPAGIQLQAMSEYLTRAMGKPVQAVDLNLTDNRPIVIDGALSKLAEIATPVDSVDKSE